MLEQLTAQIDHRDDPVYREADIRAAATTVITVGGNGLLAVREDGNAVSFIVFEFSMSDIGGANATYERVFHGNGYAGLRELRHTYWGEADNAGYIFYPSASLITDALRELRRWFNCE